MAEDKQFDVDLIKRITFSFGDHIIDSYSSNTIRILSKVERSENRVVFDCLFLAKLPRLVCSIFSLGQERGQAARFGDGPDGDCENGGAVQGHLFGTTGA